MGSKAKCPGEMIRWPLVGAQTGLVQEVGRTGVGRADWPASASPTRSHPLQKVLPLCSMQFVVPCLGRPRGEGGTMQYLRRRTSANSCDFGIIGRGGGMVRISRRN